MRNPKFIKIACIAGTSIVLVGCQNHHNQYENKTIIKVDTTKEVETTSYQPTEEITNIIQETTATESITVKETEPTTIILPIVEDTTTFFGNPIMEETTTKTQTIYTDEEVVDYMNEVSNKISECSDFVVEGVKEGFITVVDFLFYDGTIGGRTFDSLKDSTKSTVVKIYSTIGTEIEEKWPIWKQVLTEKYQFVRELWNEKKIELVNLWEKGKQKFKTWYENFREENK